MGSSEKIHDHKTLGPGLSLRSGLLFSSSLLGTLQAARAHSTVCELYTALTQLCSPGTRKMMVEEEKSQIRGVDA